MKQDYFNTNWQEVPPLLKDATEKLFLHTIYGASMLTDVLYFVLIYTKKGLFQWPSKAVG